MRKLKRVAPGVYRGADESRNASLTVAQHAVVEVSHEKADALMAEAPDDWQDLSPPPPRPAKPKPAEPSPAATEKPAEKPKDKPQT